MAKPSEPDPASDTARCAVGSLPAAANRERRDAGSAGEPTALSRSSDAPNPFASPDHARLFAALAVGLLILLTAAVLLRLGSNGAASATSEPVRHRLNINAARASSLELLAGIGPTYAERIVNHRRRHGPFRTLRDLRKIRGIGPKRSEKIVPHIRFGPMNDRRTE